MRGTMLVNEPSFEGDLLGGPPLELSWYNREQNTSEPARAISQPSKSHVERRNLCACDCKIIRDVSGWPL